MLERRFLETISKSFRSDDILNFLRRTLRNLDTFDCLVVDSPRALLKELVAFNAEIDHFGSFHSQFDQLLGDIVHDV